MPNDNLLIIEGLKKYFQIGKGFLGRKADTVKAVDGVDLTVRKGETLGLVGESGCGKSTLGNCILRLEEPTAGSVFFENRNVLALDDKSMRKLRRNMQIIFQDPYSSLNPRKTVGQIIGEAFRIHGLLTPEQRRERIRELLSVVGLMPEHIHRYAHEFSGGQRQRICISRALALNPKLIIADEPVSALDVSVQAQVINLLVSLQEEFHLSYIFIAHDLNVVEHISDRVAVMYLGKIVELADYWDLYNAPKHPYTEALMSAVPIPHPKKKKERILLQGEIPSPINLPKGCRFSSRCHRKLDSCETHEPELKDSGKEHWVACNLY